MPNKEEEDIQAAIENLIDSTSGTLNQNLSRIKRFFKTIIMDEDIANKYYISGKRGETYTIALPRELVTLPAIFTY